MAPSTISMDEALASRLLFFEDAIRSASKSSEELFEDFDAHLDSAWEAREEILAGRPLLEWAQISAHKREKIRELILAAERLPKHAYAGTGLNDLNDPAWSVIQGLALEYFVQ